MRRLTHKEFEARFWGRVQKDGQGGCWIWAGAVNGRGYGLCKTRLAGGLATPEQLAHRIAWRLSRGEIPDGAHLCHHCDNPPCVNPEHLFVGDRQANMEDMVRKDRHARGERSARAKLTDEDVRSIRALGSLGADHWFLARVFGLSVKGIKKVVYRERWKHLAPEEAVA